MAKLVMQRKNTLWEKFKMNVRFSLIADIDVMSVRLVPKADIDNIEICQLLWNRSQPGMEYLDESVSTSLPRKVSLCERN